MDQNLKNITESFVDSMGNLGASLGISKVVAQLYALLYLSPEPLSLDDMCEELKISKGNACMNIRYLEQWQAVKKIWKKGSRKDYYQANPDIEKIILSRLKEGVNRRLTEFVRNIEKIEEVMQANENSAENKAFAQSYKKKIQKIKNLNNLVSKLVKIGGTFVF
ncbi:MAG: hypothetical protein KKH91_05515 [Elusimicrobia bacterium]|nr:hypothetical protein [Elusimicrobiota bacterium]MBU2614750.1 hypothetical protein [Elusimicrobiota bacterium]